MNIFERAARLKLRFPSPVNELTAEQLWDLPLVIARGGRPSLDSTARTVATELRSVSEDDFVEVRPDPRRTELELKLDILRHIIASKQADAAAAEKAAATAERKRKLLDALAAKETSELSGMSRAEIEAEINKLGA